MAAEVLMPTTYMGEGYGLGVYIFALDRNATYTKILIYLKDSKDNTIEVCVDENDTLRTTSAEFSGLIQNKYYTVIAELQYGDGTVKEIEGMMYAKEASMNISLLSSSQPGAGGGSVAGEQKPPSYYYPPSHYGYTSIQPIDTIVKNQGSANSCVAASLSTAMSIFKAKQSGYNEIYSTSYIYGSDQRPSDPYMISEDAIILCKEYGSPRWELFLGTENDSHETKSIDCNTFAEVIKGTYPDSTLIINNAKHQRFDSYIRVNFYDTKNVAYYIQKYGYFMFNFKISNNFYNIGRSGIVPQPEEQITRSNAFSGVTHSIALIGLTEIDGEQYWIAQNSWGYWWGDNGRCYIPCNWGYDSSEYWTLDSYGVVPGYEYKTALPEQPVNYDATQVSNNSVKCLWGKASSENISYKVFYSPDNITWSSAHIGKIDATSYVLDVTNISKTALTVSVLAINTDGYCSDLVSLWVTLHNQLSQWVWSAELEYALTNKGKVSTFTYDEWNMFVYKVLDLVQNEGQANTAIGSNPYGYPTSTTYSELLNDAKMTNTVEGRTMTARRFNLVRYCIGSMKAISPGVSNWSEIARDFVPGDIVYGKYFIILANGLNYALGY